MKTERRAIPVDELVEFDETGACGTAAVISPIGKIIDPETNTIYKYGDPDVAGPKMMKLYKKLVGIQTGDEPDEFGWITILD
jgi:branched-chain amino acid aminotransferase